MASNDLSRLTRAQLEAEHEAVVEALHDLVGKALLFELYRIENVKILWARSKS